MSEPRLIPCACLTKCCDVAEEDDHPLAVCKGLPAHPSEPLVVVELVDRLGAIRP